MKKAGVFIIIATLVTGCKDQYTTCPNIAPYLYLYGYNDAQKDTLLISSFRKGSNFSESVTDAVIYYNQNLDPKKGIDSFWFDIGKISGYINQYENYDWRYTVVSDGNHVDVTNAVRKFNKTSVNHPEPACSSPIVEATIDGKVVRDEYA